MSDASLMGYLFIEFGAGALFGYAVGFLVAMKIYKRRWPPKEAK